MMSARPFTATWSMRTSTCCQPGCRPRSAGSSTATGSTAAASPTRRTTGKSATGSRLRASARCGRCPTHAAPLGRGAERVHGRTGCGAAGRPGAGDRRLHRPPGRRPAGRRGAHRGRGPGAAGAEAALLGGGLRSRRPAARPGLGVRGRDRPAGRAARRACGRRAHGRKRTGARGRGGPPPPRRPDDHRALRSYGVPGRAPAGGGPRARVRRPHPGDPPPGPAAGRPADRAGRQAAVRLGRAQHRADRDPAAGRARWVWPAGGGLGGADRGTARRLVGDVRV